MIEKLISNISTPLKAIAVIQNSWKRHVAGATKHDFVSLSRIYNFIRRVEWDILGEPMRRNVSYISHEGISGGREHDSGYVPTKELFRTRGVHRKSHQCAIKSACVATRRRIVLTLRLSRLFRSFRKGCPRDTHTSKPAKLTENNRHAYIFISKHFSCSFLLYQCIELK